MKISVQSIVLKKAYIYKSIMVLTTKEAALYPSGKDISSSDGQNALMGKCIDGQMSPA